MSSIIVFNLPNTITKNDLREVFVNKGNMTNVQLIFTVNSKCCYFALISYQTEDEAIAAQSHFDKTYVFTKRIIVERCSEIVNESDVDNNTKNPKNIMQATNDNEINYEKNIENTVLACSLDQCNSSFVDHSQKKTSTNELFNINTLETLIKNTESKRKPKLETANMAPKCAKLALSLTSEVSSRTSQKYIENSNNPEESNKVDMQYKNIIKEFEQLSSLSFDEVISSLIVDKTSDKHTSHILFVKSILIVSLHCSPNNINEAGTLFTELLSKKILCIADITEGIDTFLKDHKKYSEDYSQLFSNIATCVAQLLISKTASFEFHNLKDAFISLKPNKSTIFFFEVLKNILHFDKSIKNHNTVIWLYEKWWLSECIHFNIFMSYNLLNEYYMINDVGVFLLSMIMYNKMKLNNGELLYDIMHNWINTCIKAEVVKCPHFIQALTITIILSSATKFRLLGNDNISFEDFIDREQAKLLTQYISYVQCERYAREFQCIYGIQMMSVMLKYPRDMVLKLCWKLCRDYNVISEESYDFFNGLQDIIFLERSISMP